MKASEFSNLAKELDAKTFSEGPKNFEIDSIGRVDKWNSNSIYWISEISYLINQDGRLSNSLIVCSKAVFASTSSVLKLSNHFIVCNSLAVALQRADMADEVRAIAVNLLK